MDGPEVITQFSSKGRPNSAKVTVSESTKYSHQMNLGIY